MADWMSPRKCCERRAGIWLQPLQQEDVVGVSADVEAISFSRELAQAKSEWRDSGREVETICLSTFSVGGGEWGQLCFPSEPRHALAVDREIERFLFIVVYSVLKNRFQPGDGGEYL